MKSQRARGSRHKLQQARSQLDGAKNLFTIHEVARGLRVVIILLYSLLVRLYLQYCVQHRSPIRRFANKLERPTSEGPPRWLGGYSTVKGVSAALFNTPRGGCREDGAKLFSNVHSDRTRGNGQKLQQGKLQLDVRKNFFLTRMHVFICKLRLAHLSMATLKNANQMTGGQNREHAFAQTPHPKNHVQFWFPHLEKDIKTEKSSETFDKDDERFGVVSIQGTN
ncbi:hypothetical protein QYF61_009180, partial [Mycteria americana]